MITKIESFCVAVLAGALFVFTLSAGPAPGESAAMLATAAGLTPAFSPSHPLWTFAVKFLALLPVGTLALKVNLFSALCGAACVGLLYLLMNTFIRYVFTESEIRGTTVTTAARIASIFASLSLTVSIPFWLISNRAHPLSFDLFLLLALVTLFSKYAETSREWIALTFAFIYGLAVVEWSTFIMFAPVFGLGFLVVHLKNEESRVAPVIRFLLAGLAGLLLYGVAAWGFYDTVGYHARSYANFFQIIWFMWIEQYLEITRGLPTQGWLLVLATSIAPCFIVLGLARSSFRREVDLYSIFLHTVLTFAAVIVVANMKISPWRVVGSSRILVTPYLLTAITFGYLVTYWWLTFSLPNRFANLSLGLPGKILGWLLVAGAAGLLVAQPVRSIDEVNGRANRTINLVASEVLASMEGRTWLISEGVLDNQVLIAAFDKGVKVNVLALSMGGSDVYMRYVATLFTDPRLRNLALVGLRPLIQEWFFRDPDIAKKVAVYGAPNLCFGSGYVPVPNGPVFLPAKNTEGIHGATLFKANEPFWSRVEASARDNFSDDKFVQAVQARLLMRASQSANNVGVLLEDLGDKDNAFAAYDRARALNPQNLSALLNLSAMIGTGYKTEKAAEIEKSIKEVASKTDPRFMWALSEVHGYVRQPDAFVHSGLYWAMSGKMDLAETSLKRAVDLAPKGGAPMAKAALAGVYLAQKENTESEKLYRELLGSNPTNLTALVGLAKLKLRAGDAREADALLDKAQKYGVRETVIALDRASGYLMDGQTNKACQYLEGVVAKEPAFSGGWMMLARTEFFAADEKKLTALSEKVQDTKEVPASVSSAIRGLVAILQNDLTGARKHLDASLAAVPNQPFVAECVLKLDQALGDKDRAMKDAKVLLVADPENAYGNHVVGVLHMMAGELDLAEDSLRKAGEIMKTPEILNDLAWILNLRKKYEEAEKTSRAALALNDKSYVLWDTLGVILTAEEKYPEAEKAMQKAVELSKDKPSILLHMADLQSRMGNKEKAAALIETLTGMKSQMTGEDQDLMEKIRARK